MKLEDWKLYLLAGFYVIAGLNHFRDPNFYLPLIPDWLSDYSYATNLASGAAEVILGVGVLFGPARWYAAWGIVIMLVAFIPSHWYFIQIGSCTEPLCVPPWVAWVRLLIIHPLLIYWAWSIRLFKQDETSTGEPTV